MERKTFIGALDFEGLLLTLENANLEHSVRQHFPNMPPPALENIGGESEQKGNALLSETTTHMNSGDASEDTREKVAQIITIDKLGVEIWCAPRLTRIASLGNESDIVTQHTRQVLFNLISKHLNSPC